MGNPYWDTEDWDNAESISGRSYDRQVYGGRGADRVGTDLLRNQRAQSGASRRRYYNRTGEGRYWRDREEQRRRGGQGTGWSRAAYGEGTYDVSDWPPEGSRRDTGDWSTPGEMTGRGPRNYQRSDERIMEDVCDRLTQHGWVDASDITVRVEDGEVTLEGTAEDRRMKRMAEDAAESVLGVKDVHNRLRLGEAAKEGQGARDEGRGATDERRKTKDGR